MKDLVVLGLDDPSSWHWHPVRPRFRETGGLDPCEGIDAYSD